MTKTKFKKVGNRIRNNFGMAERMIKLSPVLSEMNLDLKQFYNEREDRSIEGTFEVKLDLNNVVAKNFLNDIKDDYYWKYKGAHLPTIEEIISRKTMDGKRLARLWKSQEVPQYWIDRYSALNFTEGLGELYLTVSSAPHMIMGVSAFGKGWGGYNGTSCLDFRYREPNQKHLLGLLSSARVYVAFLHEGKDDFRSIKTPEKHSKAIGRATLIMDDEGKVFYNTKMYFNNNTTRDILKVTLNDMFDIEYNMNEDAIGDMFEDYDIEHTDGVEEFERYLKRYGYNYKVLDGKMKQVKCKTDFEMSCTITFRVPYNKIQVVMQGANKVGWLLECPDPKNLKVSHHGSEDAPLLDSSWLFKLPRDSEQLNTFYDNPLKELKVNRPCGDYDWDSKMTTVYESEHIKKPNQIFISANSTIYSYSEPEEMVFEFSNYDEVIAEVEQHAGIYSEGSFLSVDGKFIIVH